MYVVIRTSENDTVYHYVRLLANNGVSTDDKLTNAVILSTSALATKLRDVCSAIDADNTYEIREVVIEEVS